MQSLQWYWRRLRSMSPGEIWWRLGSGVQESVGAYVRPGNGQTLSLSQIAQVNGNGWTSCGRLFGSSTPATVNNTATDSSLEQWREDLIHRAELICQNRLTIFDLEDHDLGPEINWNYEYAQGKSTPTGLAKRIDYRDCEVTGDAKVVWEPNRQQHLAVLGRAYRLTGERRYALKLLEHIESWIEQCRFGTGMNWRSPLELAIRLINWAWALDLIAPSGELTNERAQSILPAVYCHLSEISRKYSRYSSANNHLIGEAAGVFVGSSYFNCLKRAPDWAARSQAILLEEIVRQTYPDGGTREQAMGYHVFVAEFFLLAGLVARRVGSDFPAEYWTRLERMFDFLAAFVEGGDSLPMFGDCDDGYVLDYGRRENRARNLLAVGAALWGRQDLKALSEGHGEAAFWLLGEAGLDAYERLGVNNAAARSNERNSNAIQSRAFPESGYYLLQSGHAGAADRISVTFDCGNLGFGPLAAHGHADALSFTLRAFGTDIFVDLGTYDYFTHPQWREYFRSARAHNTVTVDDTDQSEMLGPFLWGRRANARCLRWSPSVQGGAVIGEHDGYNVLSDPVTHRRTVVLNGHLSEVVVQDELIGREGHQATIYLHLAEHCRAEATGGNEYRIDCAQGVVTLRLDTCLKIEVLHSSVDPIAGWVSRSYHRKEPSTTIVGRCQWSGRLTVETRITVGEARG